MSRELKVKSILGRGYSCNVFLVKSEENFLVDAGMDMVENVKKKVDGTNIESIVLTHRHIDHVADAERLSTELDATLYAPGKEAKALREGDDRTILSSSFGRSLSPLKIETLDTDIFSCFEVLLTPGHTEGSICLYHEDEKILFSGDTVFANGGAGRTDLPTGNRDELIESIGKLEKLEVDSLYPGHMSVVKEEAEKHIKRSLKNLRMF
ncbi:MAG: MBL fold metallo-hydrolase [Candidatus Thermoplasmatota archaeon]|nr:MBL fold metallo-hydrolase [Candidatus Thermoplasmatota archaeon]MBS3790245.1 MBL fold metallo-hydrolase [Candidatus Thermoplasmatota archaeon]